MRAAAASYVDEAAVEDAPTSTIGAATSSFDVSAPATTCAAAGQSTVHDATSAGTCNAAHGTTFTAPTSFTRGATSTIDKVPSPVREEDVAVDGEVALRLAATAAASFVTARFAASRVTATFASQCLAFMDASSTESERGCLRTDSGLDGGCSNALGHGCNLGRDVGRSGDGGRDVGRGLDSSCDVGRGRDVLLLAPCMAATATMMGRSCGSKVDSELDLKWLRS